MIRIVLPTDFSKNAWHAIKYATFLFEQSPCTFIIIHAHQVSPSGKIVIEPEYLNLTEFNEGYAVGILITKDFRGKNNFQLNIYDYRFSEVLLDTAGDIMLLINKRDGISMSVRRYELPELRAKFLSVNTLAVKSSTNTWEIRKLEL